ncbi:MAG TPA: 1,6-dihydroxycyclohexa-2,4-diene-1-carboxylate dehydrogenase [Dongiaceae bacterium]|nr:1,6-dihydroxycyclohexa-2,4-diene-1-carboxylate dehydrogenase [Dongiaceae bacterium]
MNRDRFTDKVVMVTGAAQGIGRAAAIAIAAEGGRLVLVDRAEIVREVEQEIVTGGGSVISVLADLERYDGCLAAVDAGIARFGHIDILINNVGGTIWAKPYDQYAEDEIEAEIRRSLFPTLWCCRAALPGMIARGRGAIVNISSVATRGIHRVPYAAAKGGVNAITASLAFEQAGNGIRVNAVAPGGTEAPARRIPRNPNKLGDQEAIWYQAIVDQTVASSLMKRYGTLEEQVGAILFLASDQASYITGTVLPVAGGDLG